MAVAKSLLRFRLAKPSCFRLDAIAGALLVIAQMQSCATCSAFQSRFSSRLSRCSSFASTAIRMRRTPIVTPPCRQQLVSTAISGKLASSVSTAPTTQLCLHYLWLNRGQRYINRKPETAVSTLAWRIRGDNPRCCVRDTCVPTSTHATLGQSANRIALVGQRWHEQNSPPQR